MANKKINQLVAKTTIQSTDLFPLGDASTGQLFKKTIADLQAAIGGAVISVNGLVGTVVLDTDDIQELASPTNRYFTDARARAAISLTVSGNSGASTYNSSTGVLNVPTYTLAGLGGITASFLSGASGIAYNSSTGVITYTGTVFTDASIRALVSAGAGLSYNSSTGVFSYSGTVYTDASIRALISLTTSGTSGASTYNNTTGVLNVPTYTLAGLGGIGSGFLSGGAGITYNSSTGVIAYSGTVYTDASVRGLFSGTAPITYNSSTGAIGITQASGSTNGFLSSTDWTIFNGKQSALTLGNVSEVVSNVLMFPDGQNGKTIGNLSIQVVQAGSTTNGFLSTTDWNTFNNKQGTITLTTTGTSGNATFGSGTLNIPNYGTALSGYLPLTGGTLTGGLFGTTASFSGLITSTIGTNNYLRAANTTTSGLFIENSNNGNTSYFGINNSTGSLFFTGSTAYSTNIGTASARDFQIGTNGVVRATINSLGNVLVGTSTDRTTVIGGLGTGQTIGGSGTPNLAIHNTGNTNWVYSTAVGNDGTVYHYNQGNTGMLYYTNGTERMRLTSGGEMIVGATSMAYTSSQGYVAGFKSASSSQTFISIARGTQTLGTGGIIFGLDANTGYLIMNENLPFSFFTNALERGRITTGGNWLLGTQTDNGERLYVSGSIRATGSITANSDARLKKNIERIENALQKVSEISGYTYNTIYDEDRHAGVIAQEIDKVLPEIVNKGNDGLMGVEYGNISALLIEAIKDLKKDNESLRAIVEGLSK